MLQESACNPITEAAELSAPHSDLQRSNASLPLIQGSGSSHNEIQSQGGKRRRSRRKLNQVNNFVLVHASKVHSIAFLVM